MAARSIWNGTVTFGTVAVPVKLFTAIEPRGLSFREVRAEDGARVRHRRIGAQTGDEVPFKEIEKAYDTGRGQVILTKEEIAAADGPRAKIVEIEHFVRASQIDPVLYDKPYHLGARDGGAHAYRVLLAALERSGRVGIGRFVLRQRERLVALRPLQGALALQTLRFADELVDPDDLELPSLKREPAKREVQMAGKLVEMLSGAWEPEEYRDTYREAVMELIEAKRQGREPDEPAREEESGDDLMAALEASLAGGGGRGGGGAGAGSTGGRGGAHARGTSSADRKASRARKAETVRKSTAAKKSAAAAKSSTAKKPGSSGRTSGAGRSTGATKKRTPTKKGGS
ncbi:MAG: Ku protein [Solirubrobacteraceae bacterium]